MALSSAQVGGGVLPEVLHREPGLVLGGELEAEFPPEDPAEGLGPRGDALREAVDDLLADVSVRICSHVVGQVRDPDGFRV